MLDVTCNAQEPHQLVYYYGYISIPETDISAILFGETHVFLRFSKRVLVRVGNDKSSLNAALFNIKKAEGMLSDRTASGSEGVLKSENAPNMHSARERECVCV
jgi:hypothetical protein